MNQSRAASDSPWARATFLLLGLILAVRFAAIAASPLNLYADEAQYWRWGQDLAWGYYSKPPMIAWVIHATTALLGHAEWAVRLAAPLFHAMAAVFLFLLGRDMFDARTGFFAALGYALMPAVILSSSVISTDGMLMPFWCAALWCAWRLRQGDRHWAAVAGLGAAIGLGVLSKYAMLYLLIGLALAALADRPSRRALLSLRGGAAAVLAGLLVAPHFAWNAANDFATVSHTVDNANLGGDLFNPENALSFVVDQLGVFGPISFLALIGGLIVARTKDADLRARDRWLLCFILPVLVFILGQAVLSRAHANWAATAYPAASLLVAAWLTRAAPGRTVWIWAGAIGFLAGLLIPDVSLLTRLIAASVIAATVVAGGWLAALRPVGLLWASLGLHAFAGVVFTTIAFLPPTATTGLGLDNALKRTRGWDASAEVVFREAERVGATAVLVDEREAWHGLDYYARDRTIPLLSWRRYAGPKSFSETQPLEGPLAERVLVASLHADLRPRLRDDFESFEPAGQIRIDLGRRGNGCPITRVFQLYVATGYAPKARTPVWEDAFRGQREFAEPPCPAGP